MAEGDWGKHRNDIEQKGPEPSFQVYNDGIHLFGSTENPYGGGQIKLSRRDDNETLTGNDLIKAIRIVKSMKVSRDRQGDLMAVDMILKEIESSLGKEIADAIEIEEMD